MWGAIIGAILSQIDRNNNGNSNLSGIYNTARGAWARYNTNIKNTNTP